MYLQMAVKDFKDLGVGKKFVKGLKELNIVEPTEIQAEVIPLLLERKTDLVGQAQTGTGNDPDPPVGRSTIRRQSHPRPGQRTGQSLRWAGRFPPAN
jgi:hypothetical protein